LKSRDGLVPGGKQKVTTSHNGFSEEVSHRKELGPRVAEKQNANPSCPRSGAEEATNNQSAFRTLPEAASQGRAGEEALARGRADRAVRVEGSDMSERQPEVYAYEPLPPRVAACNCPR